MRMKRQWKWRYVIPAALVGGPVAIAIFVVVAGGIVMLLWNWLLPPLFEWPSITLWQGFGLLVLCRILFGGWGRGSHRHRHWSPAEREHVRRRMRERFHGTPEADPNMPTDA